MAKKEPTIKVRLEGFSGFSILDVQVQAKKDGTAEIPERITTSVEFLRLVDELGVKGLRIANLGEVTEDEEGVQ